MRHYINPKKKNHRKNVEEFVREIESRYPWLNFFFPNYELAPWHVQGKVITDAGYEIYVNFWPCAGKAQRDGMKAVEGIPAIKSMLAELIDDCRDIGDDPEVLE